MKTIAFISSLSLFAYFGYFVSDNYKGTEVTITIPQLNNDRIKNQLENEFKKDRTIEYIDSSLLTNTIVIKVDDRVYSQRKIEHILEKWGCNSIDYYYRKLSDLN